MPPFPLVEDSKVGGGGAVNTYALAINTSVI